MKMIFSHTFWVFVAAAICAATLLHISQKVQQAETHLAGLQAQIAEEETTVRVLGAEWEYLNSPARLEVLSGAYLDLVPADGGVAALSADELPPLEDLYETPTESILDAPGIMAKTPPAPTYQPASYVTNAPKAKPSTPRSAVRASAKNALVQKLSPKANPLKSPSKETPHNNIGNLLQHGGGE